MADPIIPSFTWTPNVTALSYTVNGNTYPYTTQADSISRPSSDGRYAAYYTNNNQLLTFTASAVVPSGLAIVEYRWDMGEGTIKYGSVITHTYITAAPGTTVNLTVTDTLNRTFSASRVLNLRRANIIEISGFRNPRG